MDINKKHPEKDAVIVDYGIIIVMMPLVLAGSFIGVLVNLSLPGIILSAMLTLILIALTIQSWYKFNTLYAKETKLMEAQRRQAKKQVLGATANEDGVMPSPPGTSKEKYGKFEDDDELHIED